MTRPALSMNRLTATSNAAQESSRQGRTAGPPDPQRLAGAAILGSPNPFDAAELLRVGTPRGPIHVWPLVALLLWCVCLGPAMRAAEPGVLSPHRVAELRQVTSAMMAPDGSRVAYTLSVPRKPGVD